MTFVKIAAIASWLMMILAGAVSAYTYDASQRPAADWNINCEIRTQCVEGDCSPFSAPLEIGILNADPDQPIGKDGERMVIGSINWNGTVLDSHLLIRSDGGIIDNQIFPSSPSRKMSLIVTKGGELRLTELDQMAPHLVSHLGKCASMTS